MSTTSRSDLLDDKLKSIMSRRRKRLDKIGVASGDFIAVDDSRYEAVDRVERAAERATATVIASATVATNRHWLGEPPEREIRTIEDLADYVDRERRSVDGLTHDDARGPKNQIALEIAIQAIENVNWTLDELLGQGEGDHPNWREPEPTDVYGAGRRLATMAKWLDRQITSPKRGKSNRQSDQSYDQKKNLNVAGEEKRRNSCAACESSKSSSVRETNPR